MRETYPHKKWVLYQFDHYQKPSYRIDFIHISLIEGLLIQKSKEKTPFCLHERKRGFRMISEALVLLKNQRLLTPKEKGLYDDLFGARNELIHKIIEKDQDIIDKEVVNLYCLIRNVYKKSDLINNLFKERGYKFEPKDKFKSREKLPQKPFDA